MAPQSAADVAGRGQNLEAARVRIGPEGHGNVIAERVRERRNLRR
jgi:hypothetical protein